MFDRRVCSISIVFVWCLIHHQIFVNSLQSTDRDQNKFISNRSERMKKTKQYKNVRTLVHIVDTERITKAKIIKRNKVRNEKRKNKKK